MPSDAECPKCNENFDVSEIHMNRGGDSLMFDAECPSCGARLEIEVEIAEVYYHASLKPESPNAN